MLRTRVNKNGWSCREPPTVSRCIFLLYNKKDMLSEHAHGASFIFQVLVLSVLCVATFMVHQYKVSSCLSENCDKHNTILYVRKVLLIILPLIVVLQLMAVTNINFSSLMTLVISTLGILIYVSNDIVADIATGVIYVHSNSKLKVGNVVKLNLKACDSCSLQNSTVTIKELGATYMIAQTTSQETMQVRYGKIKSISVVS